MQMRIKSGEKIKQWCTRRDHRNKGESGKKILMNFGKTYSPGITYVISPPIQRLPSVSLSCCPAYLPVEHVPYKNKRRFTLAAVAWLVGASSYTLEGHGFGRMREVRRQLINTDVFVSLLV